MWGRHPPQLTEPLCRGVAWAERGCSSASEGKQEEPNKHATLPHPTLTPPNPPRIHRRTVTNRGKSRRASSLPGSGVCLRRESERGERRGPDLLHPWEKLPSGAKTYACRRPMGPRRKITATHSAANPRGRAPRGPVQWLCLTPHPPLVPHPRPPLPAVQRVKGEKLGKGSRSLFVLLIRRRQRDNMHISVRGCNSLHPSRPFSGDPVQFSMSGRPQETSSVFGE